MMTNSNFTNTNFNSSNVDGISIGNSNLVNTNWNNGNINNSSFNNSLLNNISFQNTKLNNVTIKNSSINNSNFVNSVFTNTNITSSDLDHSVFSNSLIVNSTIKDSSPNRVLMDSVLLTNSIITDSNGNNSNFSNSNFNQTSIINSNLSSSDFNKTVWGNIEDSIKHIYIPKINTSFISITQDTSSLTITGINLSPSGTNTISLRLKDNNNIINYSSIVINSDNEIIVYGLNLNNVRDIIYAEILTTDSISIQTRVANVVSNNTAPSILVSSVVPEIASNGTVLKIFGNNFTANSSLSLTTQNNQSLSDFQFTIDSPNSISIIFNRLPPLNTAISATVTSQDQIVSNTAIIGIVSSAWLPPILIKNTSLILNNVVVVKALNLSSTNNNVELFTRIDGKFVKIDGVFTSPSGLQNIAVNISRTQIQNIAVNISRTQITIHLKQYLPDGPLFAKIISNGVPSEGEPIQIGSIAKNIPIIQDNRTRIINSNLSQSSFNLANFTNAILFNSLFINSDFRNAKFTNTIISRSNFSNSDLRGADLSEAILDNSVFCGARHDNYTLWPRNFDYLSYTICAGSTTINSNIDSITIGDNKGIWRVNSLTVTNHSDEENI